MYVLFRPFLTIKYHFDLDTGLKIGVLQVQYKIVMDMYCFLMGLMCHYMFENNLEIFMDFGSIAFYHFYVSKIMKC